MPTQEQLRQRTADLERDSPEAWADRIPWWARVLGIDRIRLFRLRGLSGSEAVRTPLTALPRVVDAHEDRAEMVVELLSHLEVWQRFARKWAIRPKIVLCKYL